MENLSRRIPKRRPTHPPSNLPLIEDQNTLVLSELKLVQQENHRIRQEFFTMLKQEVSCLQSQIEQQNCEIHTLRATVGHLQDYIQAKDQADLSNTLEISGIPEWPVECVTDLVIAAVTKLGPAINNKDINWAHRSGPKKVNTPSGQKYIDRPIVVKLVQRSKCNEILNAAKFKRNISTEGIIDVSTTPQRIYFNERLTKERRMLFQEARYRIKIFEYKFCWTKNGVIHIRKDDGAPSKAIYTLEDLERYLGTDSVC